MFDKATLDALMKQMQAAGMIAQPSATSQLLSALQSAPDVAAKLLAYMAAKQELQEMSRELTRLQAAVRTVEVTLEQMGSAACGRSNAVHALVNWMVSFAESYYGLAQALQAQSAMIPRVQGYLNGQHRKSGMYRLVDTVQAVTPPQGPLSNLIQQALAQSMKNVPAFLRS